MGDPEQDGDPSLRRSDAGEGHDADDGSDSDVDADVDARYFLALAEAFVRGRLGDAVAGLSGAPLLREGRARGLRLHKFKRNDDLPRVRRVLGILRGLAAGSLLDVGSGRGTFLWPLVAALPGLAVTSVDHDPIRVRDIDAVARGGAHKLEAHQMDARALGLADESVDVVTILEVLEHLRDPRDPERAAREAMRVARRAVVASVPSKKDDNPDHHQLFTETTLTALFTSKPTGAVGARTARRVVVEHVRGHLVAVAHL